MNGPLRLSLPDGTTCSDGLGGTPLCGIPLSSGGIAPTAPYCWLYLLLFDLIEEDEDVEEEEEAFEV